MDRAECGGDARSGSPAEFPIAEGSSSYWTETPDSAPNNEGFRRLSSLTQRKGATAFQDRQGRRGVLDRNKV